MYHYQVEMEGSLESNIRRKSLSMKDNRVDTRVICALLLWYVWSAFTLFLNKYLIDLTDGDASILSMHSTPNHAIRYSLSCVT